MQIHFESKILEVVGGDAHSPLMHSHLLIPVPGMLAPPLANPYSSFKVQHNHNLLWKLPLLSSNLKAELVAFLWILFACTVL